MMAMKSGDRDRSLLLICLLMPIFMIIYGYILIGKIHRACMVKLPECLSIEFVRVAQCCPCNWPVNQPRGHIVAGGD
jgi:hypothetical protein